MKPGSLVVCINDFFPEKAGEVFNRLPEKGKVYRVRRVIPQIGAFDETWGIALEGIYGSWRHSTNLLGQPVYEEWHFRMSRFREIEGPEEKAEVEVLKEERVNKGERVMERVGAD